MRISNLLLIASAFLLLVVVGSFLLSPSSRPASEPHRDYPSLDITTAGSEGTIWSGYLMGLGILATIGISVVLGVRRNGQSGPLGRWMAVGFVCLALIYTALILSYVRYAGETGTDLFLSLPRPTAWMLYGAWLFPLLMILAGMRYFDWYLSEDDEKKFGELMRAKRSRHEDSH
jgi:hypothetical protein